MNKVQEHMALTPLPTFSVILHDTFTFRSDGGTHLVTNLCLLTLSKKSVVLKCLHKDPRAKEF